MANICKHWTWQAAVKYVIPFAGALPGIVSSTATRPGGWPGDGHSFTISNVVPSFYLSVQSYPRWFWIPPISGFAKPRIQLQWKTSACSLAGRSCNVQAWKLIYKHILHDISTNHCHEHVMCLNISAFLHVFCSLLYRCFPRCGETSPAVSLVERFRCTVSGVSGPFTIATARQRKGSHFGYGTLGWASCDAPTSKTMAVGCTVSCFVFLLNGFIQIVHSWSKHIFG